MYWTPNILAVANRTVDSPELIGALQARGLRGPAAFTILVPSAPSDRAAARVGLEAAIERLCDAGLDARGALGDADPIVAVEETWNPAEFDEVIVSTLPTQASKWLRIDLPHRLARL